MDEKNRHLPKDAILSVADDCKDKTFGDLGLASINKANKGGLGAFIEENVFKYPPNSDDNPDFIDEGIELKVTPVKQNADNTYSSKERLVLNMINFNDEVSKTFETSSFYRKNRRLLIMYYLWSKGIPASDYRILDYDLFEFEDYKKYKGIIRRDWEIIHQKIVDGKAHEISESDTTFLAACTKGANSSILTTQPNSSILAKPRAYSFKNGFMTRLFRQKMQELAPYCSFISDDEWMNNPLEEIYKEKLSIYHGLSVDELKTKFYIKTNPKDICFRIAQKMLGIEGNSTATQEMVDGGIKLKTIRLNRNDTPHESMSFPAFDFTELLDKKWEESDIREDFVDWKLMFFIFKDDEHGVCRFDRVAFWNIPNSVVDGPIKEMFEVCASLIKNGKVIMAVNQNGTVQDYFPKETEKRGGNGVCHVRPHGRVASDTFKLPVPDKLTGMVEYTKQCFWFNKLYIKEVLKKI